MDKHIRIGKLKYQENKRSYGLAVLAMLANQFYLIQVMNNLTINFHVGIEILLNLFIYLVIFLGMEKVKKHHYNWSIAFIGIGFAFFLRILYMPSRIANSASMQMALGTDRSIRVAENLTKAAQLASVALVVAGVLIILSGIFGYKQAASIKKYYAEEKALQEGHVNG